VFDQELGLMEEYRSAAPQADQRTRQTDRQTDEEIDAEMKINTHRQTDIQKYRQIDTIRQPDRER